MSRKLQPVQVVTYRKKIVYRAPENSKTFFDTFLGALFLQIISVVVGVATSGVGSAVVEGLALSETTAAITSATIQSLINFGINVGFDAMTKYLTPQSLLWDAVLSVTDLGKIGRGLKSDKLIKLINEAHLFKEIGFDEELKNFYQLKQFFKMKDVILKDNSKLIFKDVVSDELIFQSVFKVADAEMKKELKILNVDQLRRFLEMERVIYQINPKILDVNFDLNVKLADNILNNELKLSYDDFLRLDDLEATNALFFLSATTRVGSETLRNLNLARMQSRFQKNLFTRFKDFYKMLKNKVQKLNPIYWIEEFFKEIKSGVSEALKQIYDKAVGKFFGKLTNNVKDVIKKYGLIPCQPESFLLGYQFEPLIDGAGYLTIFKKPYVWKKQARISNYNPVRVWTNLVEVERFAVAESQNQFYLDNWALGFGFRQAKFKVLNFIDPKLKRILTEINKFNHELNKLHVMVTMGFVKSVKTIGETRLNKFINKQENRTFNLPLSLLGAVPGLSIFSSSILKSIKNKKWNYSWLEKDFSRKTIHVIKKESRSIKNGRII